MWTVAELLAWTQARFSEVGITAPRVDAEYLLAQALECSRLSLYVRHNDVVDAEQKQAFREHVRRRLSREPVAYVLGVRGFHALDLELNVDARVLIPRPETEHLVDWVLEDLRPAPAPPADVLDVGTGSGAISLALKKARPELRVHAVDVSTDALAVARANAKAHDLDITFGESNLLANVPCPAGGWAMIAANLPYIPSRDLDGLEPEVTKHEPRLALDGGDDGLDFVRRLIEQAASGGTLAPGGGLYLEIGIGQAAQVEPLLRTAGFEQVASRKDYADIARVVRGVWPR